jgi:four helix bundle protein
MATFRDLKVYQLCRKLNKDIFLLMKNPAFDRNVRDQLSRASMSIALNIAEGSGRFSHKDKRNFYVISRASASECIALLDIVEDLQLVTQQEADLFRSRYEELSKMLFGMIRSLDAHFQKDAG